MLCTHAVLVNQGDGQARATILRCKSWNCEHCFEARKARLIAEAASGEPERLITRTMRPSADETPDSQAVILAHAWRKLARKIVEHGWCDKLSYFCVFEAHESGWPHLHILQRGGYIDWKWLSKEWTKLTGSPGVDIRKIYDAKQCAGYVAKYIGKNPHRFEGVKRYWSTRDWDRSGWEKPDDCGAWSKTWETRDCTLAELRERWTETYPYTWFEAEMLYGGDGPADWAIDIKARDPYAKWPEDWRPPVVAARYLGRRSPAPEAVRAAAPAEIALRSKATEAALPIGG